MKIWFVSALLMLHCAAAMCAEDCCAVEEQPTTAAVEVARLARMRLSDPQTSHVVEKDFSSYFNGRNGCAVIYDPARDSFQIYNRPLAEKRDTPCSTYKIMGMLIGLESGVLRDETTQMGYDGTVYGNAAWNADVTLKEAFKASCVWYFKKVIDASGKAKALSVMERVQYGNRDASVWTEAGDSKKYWIQSSLKISPVEQTQVVARIFEGKAGVSAEHQQIMRDVMLYHDADGLKIYGKTGSGDNDKGEWVLTWYVGMAEMSGGRRYFAIQLNGNAQGEISSPMARDMIIEILKIEAKNEFKSRV